MNVNKVFILGHLGKDPEHKTLSTGGHVCNFSVATSESWKDKQGERQSRTEWHRVVVWGPRAEACGEYLRKGSLVHVEGKVATRSYEDKDGQKKYVTEIVATHVSFGKPKKEETLAPSHDFGPEPNFDSSDEIPF